MSTAIPTSTKKKVSQNEPGGNTKSPGPPQYQLYCWVWTLNATEPFEPEEPERLWRQLMPYCKKLHFQLEEGEETGYLHYQGCMSLIHKEYFATVKNIIGITAHVEPCKNWQAAVRYSSKEDTRLLGPWSHLTKWLIKLEKNELYT